MSSTRRMCRLLVDCDGSVATPTEGGAEEAVVIANLASGEATPTERYHDN